LSILNTNLKIYQINTRVWVKRFGTNCKITNVPVSYFKELAEEGINAVWLMGIWKTSAKVITECCLTPDLISTYHKALPNWTKADVIGSPFSIDDYIPDETLGSWDDFMKLKSNLNEIGLKLFLDFVPNHFSCESIHLKDNPGVFLKADEDIMSRDSYTFFKRESDNQIYAHGRDPLFPAWQDTVQVNFFNQTAREFQVKNLLKIARICDGVRCDMAMLVLNNVFNNTWSGVLSKFDYTKPKDEFWMVAVQKVKSNFPDFIFIAEVYWNLEWQLQQLGFDCTYDKVFTDRLLDGDVTSIKAHLSAERDYQMKSVRFIENHDEARAVTSFGKEKSLAAAVIMSTVQGAKLYFDGQFEGKKIKLPIQLGREPAEKVSVRVQNFYNKLLEIIKSPIFCEGKWESLELNSAGGGNISYNNMLAWQWKLNEKIIIIIVNYSDSTSQCRLKFTVDITTDNAVLIDLLNDQKYNRKVKEILNHGLFVELKAYNSHIFTLE
jgi:glycosidase